MRTGKCPKCQSNNIIRIIPQGAKVNNVLLDMEKCGVLKYSTTVRYVCMDCGFTERYFEGSELENLKKYYKK